MEKTRPGVRLVLVRTRSGKVNGLRARFYTWSGGSPPNPDEVLKKAPVYETVHEILDFIWDDSPVNGVPAGNFMILWEGFIHITEPGIYRFYIIVDDGARVWIDDKLVIDAWRDQPPTQYISAPVTLTAGYHSIKILYYNHDVFGRFVLGWITPDGEMSAVPTSNLYTRLGNDIIVKGVPPGYKVEVRNGFITREAYSKFGIVRIPFGDVREPVPAYFRVYDNTGLLVLESPVINDVWGGDEFILLSR